MSSARMLNCDASSPFPWNATHHRERNVASWFARSRLIDRTLVARVGLPKPGHFLIHVHGLLAIEPHPGDGSRGRLFTDIQGASV